MSNGKKMLVAVFGVVLFGAVFYGIFMFNVSASDRIDIAAEYVKQERPDCRILDATAVKARSSRQSAREPNVFVQIECDGTKERLSLRCVRSGCKDTYKGAY